MLRAENVIESFGWDFDVVIHCVGLTSLQEMAKCPVEAVTSIMNLAGAIWEDGVAYQAPNPFPPSEDMSKLPLCSGNNG